MLSGRDDAGAVDGGGAPEPGVLAIGVGGAGAAMLLAALHRVGGVGVVRVQAHNGVDGLGGADLGAARINLVDSVVFAARGSKSATTS